MPVYSAEIDNDVGNSVLTHAGCKDITRSTVRRANPTALTRRQIAALRVRYGTSALGCGFAAEAAQNQAATAETAASASASRQATDAIRSQVTSGGCAIHGYIAGAPNSTSA